MKIAVIGANGHVGTELCFVLKDEADVIPIVRNKMGSVFLNHHGFQCRISDISLDDDAQKTLSDIDIVVISAWVADRFSGSQNRTSKLINEKIIKNSIKFSKKDSTIVYLSTIRAFAHNVDPKTSQFWPPRYDKEKQHLEQVLLSEARKAKKRGFPLRSGHVFGGNQPNTIEIKKILSNNKKIIVAANPDNKSNIVHIVTLKDAILRCAQSDIKPQVYSIVNNPQWSWKEVYEYYNKKKSDIIFESPIPKSKSITGFIWNILKSNKKFMVPILYHAPRRFEKNILRQLGIKKMSSEIQELQNNAIITSGNFDYKPIPGPFIPGLVNTRDLLKTYSLPIFDIKPNNTNTHFV